MSVRRNIKYPEIRKDASVIDDYFGTSIVDPYRWLENINSDEVQDFVNVQNQLTDEYLRKSTSNVDGNKKGDEEDAGGGDGDDRQIRERIRARLVDLWTYCDYGCPFKRGDHYFYFKDGVLYMLHSIDDYGEQNNGQEGQIILDPSSADDGFVSDTLPTFNGTFIGLSTTANEKTDESFGDHLVSISDDGNVLAYGLSENGSVWTTIHFKNLTMTESEYGQDVLKNVRQDTYLSWTKDGQGLFYGRYPEKTLNYKNERIFYHHLGTTQKQDKLVLEFPQNPNWELYVFVVGVHKHFLAWLASYQPKKPKVTDCGEYLIVYVLRDCGGHTKIYLNQMEDLKDYLMSTTRTRLPPPPCIPLVKDFNWDYDYITNVGPRFYFLTNKNAPNSKVVSVDVTNQAEVLRADWPCVVKENKKNVLDWAICVKENYLITCYIQRVQNIVQLRTLLEGTLLHQFHLGLGSVTGHCGRAQDTNFFFKFSSFLTPGTIYRVDLESIEMTEDNSRRANCGCCGPARYKFQAPLDEVRQIVPTCFNPDNYDVNQIFYISRDGAKVSMFLVHEKNLVKNGTHPCLLVGYGGFNASLQPNFDPTYLLFMEHFNGVYAVANIRGGGEYGNTWYESGIGMQKQNSFDDFQYAARYLIRSKYTCPEKLIIRGNSNGGLVVAACINQKPELFGAAIIGFGVLDLLRFHKFSSGSCWISDYGSSENSSDFNNLRKLSPVHNVMLPQKADVQYPATLLITAKNDEIVLPLHSYKMIAELQTTIGSSSQQKNPLLMRVEPNAGHGNGGMAFEAAINEIVDILTFIMFSLDLKFKE